MNKLFRGLKLSGLAVTAALTLAGCGGSGSSATATFTVSGEVKGLHEIADCTICGIELQNNGGDNIKVAKNGPFSFTVAVSDGSTSTVSVITYPLGQDCAITAPTNVVAGNNISNVVVECTDKSYTVGGTVSGMVGAVTLQVAEEGETRVLATQPADGLFTFATPLVHGSAYNVSASTDATVQTCTASANEGNVSGSNVSNVAVVCSPIAYKVGGAISGLKGTVVLQNNGDSRTLTTNTAPVNNVGSGNFNFGLSVAYGSNFAVTVSSQPAGQNCSVISPSTTMSNADVTVSVTCSDNQYSLGGSISGWNTKGTLELQNINGATYTPKANGDYTFSSTLLYRDNYTVSVNTQPTGQKCTVSNGGDANSFAFDNITNVNVNCENLCYALVANSASNKIAGFNFLASEGVLSMQDVNVSNTTSTISTGTSPDSVAVFKDASTGISYVYVANLTPKIGSTNYVGSISSYTLGENGILTLIGASTTATGNGPRSVVVSPDGKYVYVANSLASFNTGSGSNTVTTSGNSISAYNRQANGSLVMIGSYATESAPYAVAVDPTSSHVYVANSGSTTVSIFSIGVGGVLAPLATANTGLGPRSVVIDSTGKFAYVANFTGETISMYSIDVNGLLTAMVDVSANPVTVDTGVGPISLAVSGNFVYVANSGATSAADLNGSIGVYMINTDGTLTEQTSSTTRYATGKNPTSITVDRTGKFLYVANTASSSVSMYSINSDGTLTAKTPATITNNLSGPAAITTTCPAL